MIFEVQIRIYTTGIYVYIPQELSYEDFTLKLIIQTKLLRIIYIERERRFGYADFVGRKTIARSFIL